MLTGKGLQFLPAASLFSRSVSAAAQQQKLSPPTKGQAVSASVHIHSLKKRGIFQRQHIGAVLVQFEKIPAVLVEHGKMSGDNDVLCPNPPPIGDGFSGHQLQNPGVGADVQPLADGCQKFQRVKLPLSGQAHRPCRLQG